MRKSRRQNRHLYLVSDLSAEVAPMSDSDNVPFWQKADTKIIVAPLEHLPPYKEPTNIPPEQHYPVESSHIRILCAAVGALMRRRHGDLNKKSLEIPPRHMSMASPYLYDSHPLVGCTYDETAERIAVQFSASLRAAHESKNRWQSVLTFEAPKNIAAGQPDPATASRARYFLPAGTEMMPLPQPDATRPVTVYQARAIFSMLRHAIGFHSRDWSHIPEVPDGEIPFVFDNLNIPRITEPWKEWWERGRAQRERDDLRMLGLPIPGFEKD